MKSSFQSMSMGVNPTTSPTSTNVWFYFYFLTSDQNLAKLYAQTIINSLGSQASLSLVQFSSIDSSNGYTDVYYNAHLDWPAMFDVVNNSIPRNYGGLAETLNVSDARYLSFDVDKINDQLKTRINVEFHDLVDKQSGTFDLSLNSLLRVQNIKPNNITDYLTLSINLPYVANETTSFVESSDTSVSYRSYPPQTQDDEGSKYIDVTLYSGAYYDSATLGFDYAFTLSDWQNRDSLYWDIDRRGYSQYNLITEGLTRGMTPNLLATSNLLDQAVDVSYRLRNPVVTDNSTNMQYLHIELLQAGKTFTQLNSTATAIITELASLGIDLTLSGYSNSSYYISSNSTYVASTLFDYSGDIQTESEFLSIVQATDVYKKSAMYAMTDITQMNSFYWDLFTVRFGVANRFQMILNPLSDYNTRSVPSFPQDMYSTHKIDLINPIGLGWNGTIPFNQYSDEYYADVSIPYNGDIDGISTTPTNNYGEGYNMHWYNNSGSEYNSLGLSGWIDSAKPNITGTYAGPLTEMSLSFNYKFYNSSSDLEAPSASTAIAYSPDNPAYGPYSGYSHYDYISNNYYGFNQTVDLAVPVHESSYPQVWDGTQLVPRFPSSGITSVTSYFYRSDSPINHPLFNKQLQFTHNSSWVNDSPNNQIWDASLNTTSLPDGQYKLNVETKDNAGNIGTDYMGTFTINNYADNLLPASIIWDSDAPKDGDGIRDIAEFGFTVKDDVGTYAVIAYNNLGGYIQDAVSTFNNASGNYATYNFKVDTEAQGLPEDAPLAITIKVLDMDGHWSEAVVHVTVDNHPIGNAPTVSLVSPADGTSVDNTVDDTMTFQADVQDDWGVKKVEIKFTGPSDKAFSMFFNNDTGYYEYTADLAYFYGNYSWNVVATDIDQNTHIVSASNDFALHVTGDPSLADDMKPTISLITPQDGDSVVGLVDIVAEVKDNTAVDQVIFINEDGVESQMVAGSGSNYTITWNSRNVADGQIKLTIKARDLAGNAYKYDFYLNTENGRVATAPQLGLPGFEMYLTIIGIFAMVPIIKLRRKS